MSISTVFIFIEITFAFVYIVALLVIVFVITCSLTFSCVLFNCRGDATYVYNLWIFKCCDVYRCENLLCSNSEENEDENYDNIIKSNGNIEPQKQLSGPKD